MNRKIAVVLFNLGGPDNPEAIEPFLRNLFGDPRILRVPDFIRPWLAARIARKRAPVARNIYRKLGGASPLLANTQKQARALEDALADCGDVRCFTAMRYWAPRARDVVEDMEIFAPDALVLLPLYPQYSTTTSESSLNEFWTEIQAADGGLHARWQDEMPVRTICCYPRQRGFVAALAASVKEAYLRTRPFGKPRLLLSAHGLPEKIIRQGDPYQWQCEATAKALIKALDFPDMDWVNCYQSRVGPLKWIGPATEDEIMRAGRDQVPVVLVPIAFVSEHVETLVELDIEYRKLAAKAGVPFFARVPTVGTAPPFILGLASLVRQALQSEESTICPKGKRICPRSFKACPASLGSSAA